MSWQASQWAANVPHGLVGYVAFRALTMLANDAKEDGRATWLETSTVAARLGVSHRTAERAYEELRNARLIKYGDQRHVAHLPQNRRPKVYDLTMLSHADLLNGGAPAELEGVEPGPTDLSAHPAGAQNPGPTDLSAPTTVVAVNKEEPPLTTTKTYPGQPQRAAARPVDNLPRGRHVADAIAADAAANAAERCPRWRGSMPHTFVRGRCVDCKQDQGSLVVAQLALAAPSGAGL